MANPKLSDVQRRVMKWLGYGWHSEPGSGTAIHIKGERVCNVDTLFAEGDRGWIRADPAALPLNRTRRSQFENGR